MRIVCIGGGAAGLYFALTGTFLVTRAALPSLRRSGNGRIVNITSTAGLVGYPYVSAYCASKHGVVGATRALALTKTDITVNAVCPGFAGTPLIDEAVETITRSQQPAGPASHADGSRECGALAGRGAGHVDYRPDRRRGRWRSHDRLTCERWQPERHAAPGFRAL